MASEDSVSFDDSASLRGLTHQLLGVRVKVRTVRAFKHHGSLVLRKLAVLVSCVQAADDLAHTFLSQAQSAVGCSSGVATQSAVGCSSGAGLTAPFSGAAKYNRACGNLCVIVQAIMLVCVHR